MQTICQHRKPNWQRKTLCEKQPEHKANCKTKTKQRPHKENFLGGNGSVKV